MIVIHLVKPLLLIRLILMVPTLVGISLHNSIS